MTYKVEDIVTFVPFGFGRIAKRLANDPKTEIDPEIVFVHKDALAGRYFSNGEPVLSPKMEDQMNKEIEQLIGLLNNFVIRDDLVKVSDNYRKRAA